MCNHLENTRGQYLCFADLAGDFCRIRDDEGDCKRVDVVFDRYDVIRHSESKANLIDFIALELICKAKHLLLIMKSGEFIDIQHVEFTKGLVILIHFSHQLAHGSKDACH